MHHNNILCENIMAWLVNIDNLCSLLILMETPACLILATAQLGGNTMHTPVSTQILPSPPCQLPVSQVLKFPEHK